MSPIPGCTLPENARRRVPSVLTGLLATLALSCGLLVGEARPAAAAPRPTSAVTAHPGLHYGDRGSAVAWLQAALGVRPRSGYFGRKTRAAVIAFQKRRNLTPSGIVTSRVWTRLGVPRDTTLRKRLVPGTKAFGRRVMDLASVHKGKRYVRGGNGPNTFDCSGLVRYVYKKLGYKLPRTSYQMHRAVRKVSASRVAVGDLVFVRRGGRVGHVAIFAGKGYWFEASNPRRPIGKHRAWSSNVSYGRVG